MDPNEIIFDENQEAYVQIEKINTTVCLAISDSIESPEEESFNIHKHHLADFINDVHSWYEKVVLAVIDYIKRSYAVNADDRGTQLMTIYLLPPPR
jgi:type IV secretory pathway TrbF-like protein